MSNRRKPSTPKKDYTVGYGRPPAASRFQEGKSGNPRGRPKGTKSLAKVLDESLARTVTVQENGKARKMRALDVIIQGLVNDGMRRDLPALRLLFALTERYGDGGEQKVDVADLSPDDQAIINSYVTSLESSGMGTGTTSPVPGPGETQNDPDDTTSTKQEEE